MITLHTSNRPDQLPHTVVCRTRQRCPLKCDYNAVDKSLRHDPGYLAISPAWARPSLEIDGGNGCSKTGAICRITS